MNIGMTKAIASQAAKDEITKVGTGVDNVARTGVNEVKSQLDDKANKTYVDTKVATISSGTPLFASSVAGMTDNTKNYVNTTDGFLYTYNGTTFIESTVQYQSTGIADKSIDLSKTTFAKPTKNMFDKSKIFRGVFINTTNGSLVNASASYKTSDFIEVNPNETYTRTENNRMVYFNESKVIINGSDYGAGETFTTPTDCKYIRFSFTIDENIFQLEKGDKKTPYEQFNYLDLQSIKNGDINNDKIKDKAIDYNKVSFIVRGNNLLNLKTITENYFINNTNGQLASNTNYCASDFIEIDSNTQYIETYGTRLAFYDSEKLFISGLADGTNPRTFTTPSNAKYVRLSLDKTNMNKFMLSRGNTELIYEPFGYKIDDSLLEKKLKKDEILVYLPNEIYVSVGRTIELYNNQVAWCGNYNGYKFRWICNVGSAMKRKFTITGKADKIGNYNLQLIVYDNNMNEVAKTSTTIKIVPNTFNTNKKILNIGDSLSNDKPWYNEVISLSNNKISFIGTKGVETGYKHEGRSGFSARNYLTATPYTFNDNETVHKFWDGTRFNYNYYKTQNNVSPDIVQIFLGTNNIALDPTQNANDIKQIVDYIRQDDANIPIFVVNTLYMGSQDGIGIQKGSDGYSSGLVGKWKLEEDRKVFNLLVKLNELLKGMNKVYIIPIALTHDSEYNLEVWRHQ